MGQFLHVVAAGDDANAPVTTMLNPVRAALAGCTTFCQASMTKVVSGFSGRSKASGLSGMTTIMPRPPASVSP
jgi:hypothetical protein